jgi:hypothetical protein
MPDTPLPDEPHYDAWAVHWEFWSSLFSGGAASLSDAFRASSQKASLLGWWSDRAHRLRRAILHPQAVLDTLTCPPPTI